MTSVFLIFTKGEGYRTRSKVTEVDVLRYLNDSFFFPQAAGVCRPLVSTVIGRDENQYLTESLDRSRYRNSEMPQAFTTDVILNAYTKVIIFLNL